MNKIFTFRNVAFVVFIIAMAVAAAHAQTPSVEAKLPIVDKVKLAELKQASTEAQLIETQFNLAQSQLQLAQKTYDEVVAKLQATYKPVIERVNTEKDKIFTDLKLDSKTHEIDLGTGQVVLKPTEAK